MQGHPQDFACGGLGFGRGFDDFHTPRLAPPTGVDLSLDDDDLRPQGLGRFFRLLWSGRQMTGGYGHAELTEQGLGLVFMDIHRALRDKNQISS